MVTTQAACLLFALLGAPETVLLDFSAEWCGPCQQLAPTIHQLETMGYPVRKVDVDQEKALAAKYQVQSIPCLVLLVDGQEVDRKLGAVGLNELQAMFAQAGIEAPYAPPAGIRNVAPTTAQPAAIALPSTPSAAPLGHTAAPSFQPASASPTPGGALSHLHDQLLRASVRLKIEDPNGQSCGSGTIIDTRSGEALILTCGHLFRDSKGQGRIRVDLFGPGAPQGIEGELIDFDDRMDVGLVSIRPGVPVTAAPVALLSAAPTAGSPVASVGCNNGDDPTVIESSVASIDKYLGPPNLQVAGQPVEGRSGGGLFDAQGRVVGVCNAADPADNEGLYAALGTIHALLDRAELTFVYDNSVEADLQHAAAPTDFDPPQMPRSMPGQTASLGQLVPIVREQVEPGSTADPVDALAATPAQLVSNETAESGFTTEEQAAWEEIRAKSGSAEVVCVIRSLDDPRAKSEIIVLDRASNAFLQSLASEQSRQQARHLTSLALPHPTAAPAPRGAVVPTDAWRPTGQPTVRR